MFKHILFPTDDSPAARMAALRIARLIEPDAASTRVTVAVAYSPLNASDSDLDEEFVQKQNAKNAEMAAQMLGHTANIFESCGIKVAHKVIEGSPVSAAIAAEAAHGDYDAIALGSRGMSMKKDVLHYLGSVAERVIRRSSIPVIVLPIHDPVDNDERD